MNTRVFILFIIYVLMTSTEILATPPSVAAHRELLLKQARDETLDVNIRLRLYDSVQNLGDNINTPVLAREKALLWQKLRNIPKEIETYRNAIDDTPKDSVKLLCHLYVDLLDAQTRDHQWENLFHDALYLYKIRKPDSLKYYDVLTDCILADAFERYGNLDKASTYAQKARKRLESLPRSSIPKESLTNTEISLLFTEGNVALDLEDYSTAISSYKKIKSMTKDDGTLALADASIALILQRQGNYELGLASGEDNILTFKGKPNGPTAVHNFLKLLLELKDTERARHLLRDYADEFNNLDSLTKNGVFEVNLAELDLLEGKYKEAFDHFIAGYETLEQELIQTRRQYSANLDSDILKWEKEQNDRPKINWQAVAVIAISLVMLMILVGGFFLIRMRRRYINMRVQSEECKSRILLLEDNKSAIVKATEEALAERTNELSKITLHLAIIQELIDDIRIASASRQMTDKEALAHIRLSLREFRSRNDIWNLFKGYFEKLNQDFFNRLYCLHPDLSNSEVRMCAFIQMGLTTKEISAMTNRSPRTVNCIKYNLRKKCRITIPTEEYLRRIAVMDGTS